MSEKVERLLARLGNIWPKKVADETLGEWLADWEGTLKPFDAWVIDAAATRMVQSRTKPGFPFPGEVAEVCRQVVADDRASKPRLGVEPDKSNPYKLASELIQCELGRRAAREGWVLTLRDFVVRNGRLPQGDAEIKKLINIRNQFQQNLIDCIDGNGGAFSRSFATLGRTMARKEYDLAQRVLGTDAEDWYATRL